MPRQFNAADYQRQMREAARKAQRQIDDYNRRVQRENQRQVDDYNNKARRHNAEQKRRIEQANRENRRVVDDYNRHVDKVNKYNRQLDANQKAAITELSRRLGSTSYTPAERELADRIQHATALHDEREWDAFLSYARIDGSHAGNELREQLERRGVRVWFDEVAIQPGKSQARQMDQGLAKAHCGIALLTPAYLAGRFWTERELGALLSKDTLIPVLHNVTFAQVAEYSGILPDLAGFETARDSIPDIADKIAAAVLLPA